MQVSNDVAPLLGDDISGFVLKESKLKLGAPQPSEDQHLTNLFGPKEQRFLNMLISCNSLVPEMTHARSGQYVLEGQ